MKKILAIILALILTLSAVTISTSAVGNDAHIVPQDADDESSPVAAGDIDTIPQSPDGDSSLSQREPSDNDLALSGADADLAGEGLGEVTVKVIDRFYFKCNSTAIVCKGDLTVGEWLTRLENYGGVKPADNAEGWKIVEVMGLYDFTERRYLRDNEYPNQNHSIDLKIKVETISDDYIFRSSNSGYNYPIYVNGMGHGADVMDVYHIIGIALKEIEYLFNVSMSVPKPTVGASPSSCVPTMNTSHVSIVEYNWYEPNPYRPDTFGYEVTTAFEDGKNYTLAVWLETDEGYDIPMLNYTEQTANITVNGKRCSYSQGVSVTKASCSFYVHYPITINAVNVTLTAPVAGAHPDFTATKDNTDCDFYPGAGLLVTHGTGLEWYDKDAGVYLEPTDAFVAGKTYSAQAWLMSKDADDQIKFADNVTVKLNGNKATITRFSDIWIVASYDFVAGTGGTLSGTVTSYLNTTDTVTVQLLQGTTVKKTTTVKGNSASYSIAGVSAGTYTLRVSKKNHTTREYSIYISGNKTQNVEIRPIGDVAPKAGVVNIRDVNALYNHVMETDIITDEYLLQCGDVDNKNGVNIRDVNALYNHVMETALLY